MTVRRIVVDHVLFAVTDLDVAKRFYEAALAPLGFGVLYEKGDCVAFGVEGIDDFSVCRSPDPTKGVHVAFISPSREAVDAFYEAALTAGGRKRIPPGLRPEYHEGYYAAYVYDPEDNNVEAVFHGPRSD